MVASIEKLECTGYLVDRIDLLNGYIVLPSMDRYSWLLLFVEIFVIFIVYYILTLALGRRIRENRSVRVTP